MTKPSISHAWRSLRHRNFKLFFAGQSISVMGTWMTRLATSWLVQAIAKLSSEEQETLFAAGKIMRRMAEGDPQ